MSTALTVPVPELVRTSEAMLAKIFRVQEEMLKTPDPEILTEHVLHGGMYSRTVTLPAGMVLIGALIKKSTLVITVGSAKVLLNDEWAEIRGYHVFPGSAGRKQVFVALSPLVITMIFPTSARTVEQAEEEFTDEAELLMSRRQANVVTVTGE